MDTPTMDKQAPAHSMDFTFMFVALTVVGLLVFAAMLGAQAAIAYRQNHQAVDARHQQDVQERQRLQAEQRSHLDMYQWLDRSAGVVAIPIDRAMDLIAIEGTGRDTDRPVGSPPPPPPRE